MRDRQSDFLWVVVLPFLVLAAGIIYWATPYLAPSTALKMTEITVLALPSQIGNFLPKPLLGLRFAALVTILPALAVLLSLGFSKIENLLERIPPRVLSIAVNLSQILLLFFVIGNFVYEQTSAQGHVYWTSWALLRIAAVFCIFWILFRKGWPQKLPKLASSIWVDGIAVFFSAWGLLPCLSTNRFLPGMIVENRWHLSFFMDEYAAVLNGKIPRIDYHPQYVSLLPYLSKPYFSLFGFSVTSFTFLMAGLSLIGLIFVYRTFCLMTEDRLQTLFLFFGFLGIAFLQAREFGGDLHFQKYYIFSYFGQSPARYLGVWSVAFFLSWYLFQPSRKRLLTLGAISGLAAMNNLDYGLCAWIAAAVTITLFHDLKSRKSWNSLLTFLLSSLPPVVLSLALIYWSGSKDAFLFEHLGILGLFALPTPVFGFYWILIVTFLAAIALSVHAFTSGKFRLSRRSGVVFGILLFYGIVGLGSLSRYMSRSHWEVLQTGFALWAIPVLIFFQLVFMGDDPSTRRNSLVTKTLVLAPVALFWVLFPSLPNILGNIQRLEFRAMASAPEPSVEDLATSVSRRVSPGKSAFIIYPNAQWIARLAHVDNPFPYIEDHCLVVKSQIDVLRRILLQKDVRWIFGKVGPEAQALFQELGFQSEKSDFEEFKIWRKQPR